MPRSAIRFWIRRVSVARLYPVKSNARLDLRWFRINSTPSAGLVSSIVSIRLLVLPAAPVHATSEEHRTQQLDVGAHVLRFVAEAGAARCPAGALGALGERDAQ